MSQHTNEPISTEALTILIEGLEGYKQRGIIDPWVLGDGTMIEPLAVLQELRQYRNGCAGLNPAAYRECVEALKSVQHELRNQAMVGEGRYFPILTEKVAQALAHAQGTG